MKEINIAEMLVKKRREKGITQDELAEYIGVTKASVSKWETGQSYPDVTFLPLLASYFNISIDELIDYKPQMQKDDIKKIYRKFSSDFTSKPFEKVMEDCRAVIKKYYSCYPLLTQMGILMVNHVELVGDPQAALPLIGEAKALFIKVKEESGDIRLIKQAQYMEAFCCLISGDANSVVSLLDGTCDVAMPAESLLASAYQMTGRTSEAKMTLQSGIYQNLVVLFNFFPAYLMLCTDNADRFEEVLRRANAVSEAFDMPHLHPSVLSGMFITAAQGYVALGNTEKALDTLRRYAELVTSDIYPLTLHGDGFFDQLDRWLGSLDQGKNLPRDEKTIRKSMADAAAVNPAFAPISDEPRFKTIVEMLRHNV